MPRPPITNTELGNLNLNRQMIVGEQNWTVRPDGPVRIATGGETQVWTNHRTRARTRLVGPQHRRAGGPIMVCREYADAMEKEDRHAYTTDS